MPAKLTQMFMNFWPILLMVVIFYFLLYRPQKKQQKAREELLSSLKKGQKVVTIGGIHGVITEMKDDIVTLQVAEKVEIRFSRGSISSVLNKKNEKEA